MRVGKNPYKYKTGRFSPAKIGIVSLCYIPFLEGFFEHSLDVYKVHLESLLLTKTEDSDLLVFDNGSCQEVTDFLEAERQRGAIDWLVLSNHNMGKTAAINWAFSVLESDYFVFTDGDILFRPGWVEESLAIFERFDKAGIVAVQPPFFDILKDEFQSPESILADGRYQIEEEVPDRCWIEEYCRGMGLSEQNLQQLETKPLLKVKTANGESEAWIGANHQQFMVSREVGSAILPLPVSGKLMPADDREINRRPEALGYWQLSTIDSYYYHIGNTLNELILQEMDTLRKIGSPQTHTEQTDSYGEKRRGVKSGIFKFLKWSLNKLPPLRGLFTRMYGFLFKLVEEQ